MKIWYVCGRGMRKRQGRKNKERIVKGPSHSAQKDELPPDYTRKLFKF